MAVDAARIAQLNARPVSTSGDCVMYWMQADQRAEDNWALTRAVELGNELNLPVVTVFMVHTGLGNAYLRHYDFMLRGLAETAQRMRAQGIGFVMYVPAEAGAAVIKEVGAMNPAAVVTDQSYLKYGRDVRSRVAEKLQMRMEAVDAATIYPPRAVYPKAAYGAYILRPKLRNLRERFLTQPPHVQPKVAWKGTSAGAVDEQNVEGVLGLLKLDGSVKPVGRKPGAEAAWQTLQRFMEQGFGVYDERRNDPVADVTSHLSAYLHFGQISSQRVAYEVLNSESYDKDSVAGEKFLDELITWRELAANNACYNPAYDSYEGIPEWAKKSLSAHEGDPRQFVYTRDELEAAATHDELWNAAQLEMLRTGRMHGYMRMYWAKKILEWSDTARGAVEATIYLNDKYFLDGRDPNGYAGILWAIGGLHDRPWFDREVYGQVRYMSYGGAKSKFDVAAYIDWAKSL